MLDPKFNCPRTVVTEILLGTARMKKKEDEDNETRVFTVTRFITVSSNLSATRTDGVMSTIYTISNCG